MFEVLVMNPIQTIRALDPVVATHRDQADIVEYVDLRMRRREARLIGDVKAAHLGVNDIA